MTTKMLTHHTHTHFKKQTGWCLCSPRGVYCCLKDVLRSRSSCSVSSASLREEGWTLATDPGPPPPPTTAPLLPLFISSSHLCGIHVELSFHFHFSSSLLPPLLSMHILLFLFPTLSPLPSPLSSPPLSSLNHFNRSVWIQPRPALSLH